MTTNTPTATPPADAVARDAHWAKTLERLRNRNRPVSKLTICDDQDAKTDLIRAQIAQNRAQAEADSDPSAEAKKALRAAEAEVRKAQQKVDEASIVLTFRALVSRALAELKKAHPPTEEQAEDGLEWNFDTFPPALVAASSEDGLTEEDARHFLETWSDVEAGALFNAAWSVQSASRMDLGKG